MDLRVAAPHEGPVEGQGAGAEVGVVEEAEDLEVEGLGGGGVGDEDSSMLDTSEPRSLTLGQQSQGSPSQGGPQPQGEEQQSQAQQRPRCKEHTYRSLYPVSRRGQLARTRNTELDKKTHLFLVSFRFSSRFLVKPSDGWPIK